MTPSIPIAVPSKGRPESSTMKLLREEGIDFTCVIEKEEAKDYEANFPKARKFILPKSNQGLAYSRQTILEAHPEWYWMLDDDIKAVYRRDIESKRCLKISFRELFDELNPIILASDHAQVSLEYQQFAWSTTAEGSRNSYCDVAVAIDAAEAKDAARYRPELELKEDRDFTLQLITSGYTTFRYQGYAFSAPKNGSNAGGLQKLYAKKGEEERRVDRMVKAWPGVCTKQVKKDGRIDCKINWKLFRQQ